MSEYRHRLAVQAAHVVSPELRAQVVYAPFEITGGARLLADGVLVADNFATSVTKVLSDTLSITDVAATYAGGFPQMFGDVAGAADAGTVVCQNYTGGGYFAEDFVGQSSTF